MRKKQRVDIYADMHQASQARDETNDCTVFSLARALRMPYDVAHLVMSRAGRKHRGAGHMHAAVALLDPGRMVEVALPVDYKITLAEFCEAHPIGRYWVGVTRHALVVENGRICDHSDGRRRRVDMAWRVYDKPTLRIGSDG